MNLEVIERAGFFRLIHTDEDGRQTDLGIRTRSEDGAKRTAARFFRSPADLAKLAAKVERAREWELRPLRIAEEAERVAKEDAAKAIGAAEQAVKDATVRVAAIRAQMKTNHSP
jgi:hypothetical protein